MPFAADATCLAVAKISAILKLARNGGLGFNSHVQKKANRKFEVA